MIIEFVGVAGSGKTTMAETLNSQNPLFQRCFYPNPRGVSNLSFYIKNCLEVWGRSASWQIEKQLLSRRELAWMAILQGWPEYLQKKYLGDQALVLDQGPIFLMAALQHFDPRRVSRLSSKKWWQEILQLWSGTLDLIIWLDTSDAILRNRLRQREKPHEMKYKSDAEIDAFLDLHRTVYQQAIALVTQDGRNPKMLAFDTADKSAAEISNLLITEVGL